MFWIMGIVAVVVIYFVWAKKRGDAFTKEVVRRSVRALVDRGEPKAAVGAFAGSDVFAVIAKGAFGKQSILDAMADLNDAYESGRDEYRRQGTASPNLADNVARILPEG